LLLLLAEQTLTNDSVIKMVKMGFPEEMIVNAINRSPGTYDTSVAGLIALKNAGVGTKAVTAIVFKDTTPAQPSAPAPPAAPPQTVPAANVPSPARTPVAETPAATSSSTPVERPQQTSPPASRRLYAEERIKTTSGTSVHCDSYGNCYGHNASHSRNVSLEVTREVMKHCPETITVTDNRDVANYVLRITPGASTLFKQDGDVAYVSPTRWKTSNLAKDLCNFVVAQH
jgi:hypothetical protein